MTERFKPEVPLAIHIELKRRSKTDRRAFTIDTVSDKTKLLWSKNRNRKKRLMIPMTTKSLSIDCASSSNFKHHSTTTTFYATNRVKEPWCDELQVFLCSNKILKTFKRWGRIHLCNWNSCWKGQKQARLWLSTWYGNQAEIFKSYFHQDYE